MLYSLDVSNKISCSMFGRMKQSHGWESNSPRIIGKNLFVFAETRQSFKVFVVLGADAVSVTRRNCVTPARLLS